MQITRLQDDKLEIRVKADEIGEIVSRIVDLKFKYGLSLKHECDGYVYYVFNAPSGILETQVNNE